MSSSESIRHVVLAYSGGLDTSVAIRWIAEKYGAAVTALSVDVGQEGELKGALERARRNGAREAKLVDAKERFVTEFLWPALQANALYEGIYPLSTALARPLIARTLGEAARAVGADAVAHGCTGKGNDQVRFDLALQTLAPELRIIAPLREWNMNREDEIRYAQTHGIEIRATHESPYSVDENLWGRSIEGGRLEDPSKAAPEEVFDWTGHPESWPKTPEDVEVEFEAGVPVALDGQRLGPVELVRAMNRRAGAHGVGRIDHVESRVVGIKSREVYECPAAVVLIAAHQALEALVLPRDLLDFKRSVEQRYAQMIYDGLWFTPLRSALDAFVDATQERVVGEVTVKLFKGSARVAGRRSSLALYQPALATYSSGDQYRRQMAEGFIYVWGLPARTWTAVGARAPAVPVATSDART